MLPTVGDMATAAVAMMQLLQMSKQLARDAER
jgi:hypothetical protein